MNRSLSAALLPLLLIACDEKSKTAPPPTPAPAVEKAPAPEKAVEKAPEPEKEPEKVAIDDAMVEKYLGAQKTIVAEIKAYAEATAADLKKVGNKDTVGALGALGRMQEREKKLEETTEAAIKKAGLTKQQYDEVHEAANDVFTSRALFEAAGGEAGVVKMETEMKAQLAKLPADERAKAEADMLEGPKNLREMARAPETRKRYGDAAVDAIDKRYAELKAMRETLLGALKEPESR